MSPQALTVPEAAELLGISPRMVYMLAAAEPRRIPVKRFGRAVRIPRWFVEDFLASRAETLEEFSSTLDTRILAE